MTRDELTALLGRVEQATGPDREIDRILAGYPRYTVGWRSVPAYTASLDAIVGLIERELPGHLWQVKQAVECQAIIWSLEADYDDRPAPTGYSATVPALALCAAFLRAKLAQVTE